MKNLGNMLKQAQQMQSRMQEMQAKLEATEVEGSSGGGMVKVRLTGKGDLRRVTIDPSLMNTDEREVLEDLLVAAHADAKQKVEATMAEEMQNAEIHADCMEARAIAYEAEVERLREGQWWIPITEKLPERYQSVLRREESAAFSGSRPRGTHGSGDAPHGNHSTYSDVARRNRIRIINKGTLI